MNILIVNAANSLTKRIANIDRHKFVVREARTDNRKLAAIATAVVKAIFLLSIRVKYSIFKYYI